MIGRGIMNQAIAYLGGGNGSAEESRAVLEVSII